VHDQVATVRATTERPFAVGFITAFLPATEAFLDAALEEATPAIVLSFGEPEPWAARVKAAGATLICQVQDFDDARRAVAAGADVLVAQGSEAGGHTGTMSLLPFLVGVVEQFPDLPVLAAGGVANGRTLAAALVAGADGVVMGTAFLATTQAIEIDDVHKDLIVASEGDDTVLTRAYDIVSGLPWPQHVVERVRRNAFTEEWRGRDAELVERAAEIGEPDQTRLETMAVLYGQSASFVRAVRPAADVLTDVSDEAEAILRARPGSLLG
jgi:nitronate monooxygenase